jgi:hypothetical protein
MPKGIFWMTALSGENAKVQVEKNGAFAATIYNIHPHAIKYTLENGNFKDANIVRASAYILKLQSYIADTAAVNKVSSKSNEDNQSLVNGSLILKNSLEKHVLNTDLTDIQYDKTKSVLYLKGMVYSPKISKPLTFFVSGPHAHSLIMTSTNVNKEFSTGTHLIRVSNLSKQMQNKPVK